MVRSELAEAILQVAAYLQWLWAVAGLIYSLSMSPWLAKTITAMNPTILQLVSSPASRLQVIALVREALYLQVLSGGVTTRTRREFADGLAFNRNNQ